MIKTIDTRNITTAMLKAQDVIDGTTTYSDPLSFKDAADIFIAMAEAAPAVEPAQSCWLRAIDEALVCHHVDVASSDDDYATAKDKLNKLLCINQDIHDYFKKSDVVERIKAEFQPVPTANKHGALMWNAALMKAIGIIEEAK